MFQPAGETAMSCLAHFLSDKLNSRTLTDVIRPNLSYVFNTLDLRILLRMKRSADFGGPCSQLAFSF